MWFWVSLKVLIANLGKSHFLTGPYQRRSLKIRDSVITSSSSEGLLGVLIDSELTFRDHITKRCSKANQTFNSKYTTLQK